MSRAVWSLPACRAEQTQAELDSRFDLAERGMVDCKGLGQMKTFFLTGRC